MRFRQYVNKETTHTIRGISIDHIINLFEKNCKPYFDDFYSIWEGEFFISGRKSNNEVFTKKKVRKNRFLLSFNPSRGIKDELKLKN